MKKSEQAFTVGLFFFLITLISEQFSTAIQTNKQTNKILECRDSSDCAKNFTAIRVLEGNIHDVGDVQLMMFALTLVGLALLGIDRFCQSSRWRVEEQGNRQLALTRACPAEIGSISKTMSVAIIVMGLILNLVSSMMAKTLSLSEDLGAETRPSITPGSGGELKREFLPSASEPAQNSLLIYWLSHAAGICGMARAASIWLGMVGIVISIGYIANKVDRFLGYDWERRRQETLLNRIDRNIREVNATRGIEMGEATTAGEESRNAVIGNAVIDREAQNNTGPSFNN